jgi:hypothetical protein
MKQLTLELYERIIDLTYEQSKENLNLLGRVTRNECANYIAFYAIHSGLFWSEQDGIIAGVATAHPGCRDFDWHWQGRDGVWTAHMVWAVNKYALAELISNFLQSRSSPVYEFHAWRRGNSTELTASKLERILFYGRLKKHNNPSTGST